MERQQLTPERLRTGLRGFLCIVVDPGPSCVRETRHVDLVLVDHRTGAVIARIAAWHGVEQLKERAVENLHLLMREEAFEIRAWSGDTLAWARCVGEPQRLVWFDQRLAA